MHVSLSGRTAVITGGSKGLGLAMAERFLKSGAAGVAILARGQGPLDEARAKLEALGLGKVAAIACDIATADGVQKGYDGAMAALGRIDIVVNNAGILRDKSFAKMTLDDFKLVMDVHVMGAVHCTKAVWPIMQAQNYGRIVMTTSSSGLVGNFGQANYGAAKMALAGLMQTLSIEGEKYGIRVNCLAPTAATRMTEGLMPQAVLDALEPQAVSPAMLVLASEQAPNRTILCAGAGSFEAAHITLTQGVHIGIGADTPERLLAALDQVRDRTGETVPKSGSEQGTLEVGKAMKAHGH